MTTTTNNTTNPTAITRTILSAEDKLDIMKTLDEGICSQRELADGYKVSIGVISRLSTGREDDVMFQLFKETKRLKFELTMLKVELYEAKK